jgi:hypothetical protein
MTSSSRFALALGLIGFATGWPVGAEPAQRISGPHTHGNLSVYFIHGADALEGKVPLTLDEALEQKLVVVRETGRVNELTIENRSDQRVFVQAGDIVKGGRQDRTLQVDLVLEPHSGQVAIGAFCVEQGRWSARGSESAEEFASSKQNLSSRELKLAARKAKSQSDVWNGVAAMQRKLSRAIDRDVRSELSDSSLPLAVENASVEARVAAYEVALAPKAAAHADAIGYAFAINGELNSAEVYGSHALFEKLWPKLLRTSAVEAVAEDGSSAAAVPLSGEQVEVMLRQARAPSTRTQKTVAGMEHLSEESDAGYFFQSNAAKQGERWIHRSYIRK